MSHFWRWPAAKQLNSKSSSSLNTLRMLEGRARCMSLQTCFRFVSVSYLANSESRATLAHPAPFTQSYQKYSRKSEKLSATMSSLKQKQQGKGPIRKAYFTHIAVRSHHFVTEQCISYMFVSKLDVKIL